MKHLSRRLSGCSDIEFRHLLDSALEELITTLAISPKTAAYLNVCLEKVSIIIKNAISRNVPEKAFLILKYPEDTPEFKCSFSGKMDDELYRKVLQEVVACQTTEEKNQIIKKYIHSLADLEDIMLDAELSKTEMISVFQELTTGELAALAKKYDIYTKCSLSDMHSSEMRLYNCLNSYIAMLAPEQQSCVKEAAKIIRVIE
ncbi:hypothetical protein SDC9_166322 [bioreactor metagenome]|uniref:Uncharacterized protein n=1 Tax=bioreactor metagenome TaxID=1076179 RepID=A0A645FWS9_9ZZZZ